MKKIGILLFAIFVFSGCAKVKHLDQLLTLKGLADEQVVMNQYIEKQDQIFELMIEEAKAGTLDQYLNKKRILRTFGDPIFVKHVKKDDQELESWLYRYPMEFFDSEKIYLPIILKDSGSEGGPGGGNTGGGNGNGIVAQ